LAPTVGLQIYSKYRGRKPSLTLERVLELQRRAGAGERKTALARDFWASRKTVYTYIKAEEALVVE
jgi:hypothetical protein